MIRKRFHQRLEELHTSLLEMGAIVEEVIELSIDGLKTQDLEKSDRAIELDKKVDQFEIDIEKQCINLLALETPVAIDLRTISTILKMITDLERIGDYAVNIAYDTKKLNNKKLIKPLVDIPIMADITKRMVRGSLDSFVKEDADLAKDIAKMDDQVDEIYVKVYEELLEKIKDNNENIEQIIHLLFIGRHLERMADHSTNICENIVYMITSKRVNF